jgi:hypothetical protein
VPGRSFKGSLVRVRLRLKTLFPLCAFYGQKNPATNLSNVNSLSQQELILILPFYPPKLFPVSIDNIGH